MAKIGCALRAGTDAHKFDLGDDEAVTALVLAHIVVEMREVLEVVDLLDRVSVTHARVPTVKGLDETNDTATAIACDGPFDVVLVSRHEVRAVTWFLGAHLDVVVFPKGGFQGGRDFRGIEVAANLLKCTHRTWLQTGLCDVRCSIGGR